ncbi:hypothetical protein BD626DRAFT_519798, partial [Schizophyllum amplum]
AGSRVEGSSDMLSEVHGTGRHVIPACKLGQCVSPAALFRLWTDRSRTEHPDDEDTVDPVSPRTSLAALILPSPSLNTQGEGGFDARQRNSQRKRSLKPSLARTAISCHDHKSRGADLVALTPPPPLPQPIATCGPHSQLVIACKRGEAGLPRSMICYLLTIVQ